MNGGIELSMKNPEEYKQEMLRMYRQNPAASHKAVQTIQPVVEDSIRPDVTENMPAQEESAVEDSIRPDVTENMPEPGESVGTPEPENRYLKEEALPVKERGRNEAPPVTERYPEPRLPSYISPMFAAEEEEPYEIPKNEDGTGYIEVRVTTGRGAVPVEGASVIISSGGNGKKEIIRTLTTDSSGNTGKVALPAPKRSGAQTEEALNDYSIYNVSVYFKSFFREESQDVPVFDGITSVQSFDLIPKPYEYDGQDGTIVYENPEPLV